MALEWVVPIVGGLGFVAFRSWREDAALRSGELMDLRDLLPGGEGDAQVRVLANRRYRVELQVEASLRTEMEADASGSVGEGQVPGEPGAGFPFELVVSRADEPGGSEGDESGLIYQGTGALEPRLDTIRSGREMSKTQAGPICTQRYAGSMALLDFVSDGLVRLRFDLTVAPSHFASTGETRTTGRLEKAYLVIKEGVRPLRRGRVAGDQIEIDSRNVL